MSLEIDAWRDPARVAALAERIKATVTRPWTVMEVCGGQTHALLRYGLMELLPPEVTLVHGPGCPVCVTSESVLSKAVLAARQRGVVLYTFGDMLRVPGPLGSLAEARAAGADVRVVSSPLESVSGAAKEPGKTAVMLAIGFETTAPTYAAALKAAEAMGLENWALLAALVRVPPAIRQLLSAPDHGLNAFLAAGHVCTVEGLADYGPLVEQFGKPIVATGFEPVDLMNGLYRAVLQLEEGRAELENAYDRMVREAGNEKARDLVRHYFRLVDQSWRGMGMIPDSGFALKDAFEKFDAEKRLELGTTEEEESSGCRSGEVLTGKLKPVDCEHFGKTCTPLNPLGATMVSAEGACQAYFRFRKAV